MRKIIILLAVLVVGFTLFAEEKKAKVAVMDIEDRSATLDPAMLDNAAEYLRGNLAATNKFVLISKDRQRQIMIKEQKKESWKECYDQNCRIQLGQALSADTLLQSSINLFGGKYTITVEMVDLAKEATVKAAKAEFDGTEAGLMKAIEEIGKQIIAAQDIQQAEPAKEMETYHPYLWSGIGTIIGGVALAVGGGVSFGIVSNKKMDDYNKKMLTANIDAAVAGGMTQEQYIKDARKLWDDARTFEALEYTFIAVGCAAVASGIVLAVWPGKREVVKQVSFIPVPGGFVVAAGLEF